MSKLDRDALYAAQLQAFYNMEAKASDEDREYARIVDLYERKLARDEKSKKDEEYARRLVENEAKNKKLTEETEARFKAIMDLQPILLSPAVQGENKAELTDAHKYTCDLIRNGLPELIAVDDRFHLSNPTQNPNDVLKEILDFVATIPASMNPPDVANINTTFKLLTDFLAATPAGIDTAESHANVPQLLSRTWDLAKKLGRDAMGQIAVVLHQNIADQGGCIPGLVARLYAPYARLIDHYLQLSLTNGSRAHRAHV